MSDIKEAEKNCINCISAGTPCYKSPCSECRDKSEWQGKAVSEINNGIQDAIEAINFVRKNYNSRDPILFDFDLAIQALQEKQEREQLKQSKEWCPTCERWWPNE